MRLGRFIATPCRLTIDRACAALTTPWWSRYEPSGPLAPPVAGILAHAELRRQHAAVDGLVAAGAGAIGGEEEHREVGALRLLVDARQRPPVDRRRDRPPPAS